MNSLTLSTLSNFNGLFQTLFWIKLKRPAGVKGLILFFVDKALFHTIKNVYHCKFVIKEIPFILNIIS